MYYYFSLQISISKILKLDRHMLLNKNLPFYFHISFIIHRRNYHPAFSHTFVWAEFSVNNDYYFLTVTAKSSGKLDYSRENVTKTNVVIIHQSHALVLDLLYLIINYVFYMYKNKDFQKQGEKICIILN